MSPVAAKTKGENKLSPLPESVHHMLDVSPVHVVLNLKCAVLIVILCSVNL